MILRRSLRVLGAAALAAAALTACSSENSPTVAEFCDVVNDTEPYEGIAPDAYDELAVALKEHVEAVEQTGTPEEMPEDARDGWQTTVDRVNELSVEEIAELYRTRELIEGSFDEDESALYDAYQDYEGQACDDEG